MLAKLCVLILGIGVVACVLLGIRQARIQAAHEMAEVQSRLDKHDRELWKLRAEVARHVTPPEVERIAGRFGKLEPIRSERFPELVRIENELATLTTITAADSIQDTSEPR